MFSREPAGLVTRQPLVDWLVLVAAFPPPPRRKPQERHFFPPKPALPRTRWFTLQAGACNRLNKVFLACLVLGGSALLAACGGDSAALTLSGTAATGKATNGGALNATCKSGTGTATSGIDGSFKNVVANGTGPCLLKITPVGGVRLYSMKRLRSVRQHNPHDQHAGELPARRARHERR